jgi:hypothetical protein
MRIPCSAKASWSRCYTTIPTGAAASERQRHGTTGMGNAPFQLVQEVLG